MLDMKCTYCLALLLCLLTMSAPLRAQDGEPLFPGLSGQGLLNQLSVSYKPEVILSFADGRDTLFSRIYGVNDSLRCVYTGHRIYLDPTMDPTVAAFMNNSANGLNTEHTYPQGKGASTGNARADLHHLYATRIDVNSDRADRPFGNVPSNQTARWYRLGQQQTSVPSANLDEYSRLGVGPAGKFEPRLDHKGNVARAIFYFYTMYRSEADLADNSYFWEQRADLCQWHLLDPVDWDEWRRTWGIAGYQEGKPNPFVLDCTLAARTYCAEITGQCSPTSAGEAAEAPFHIGLPYPTPAFADCHLDYALGREMKVQVMLFDGLGRLVGTLLDGQQGPGEYRLSMSGEQWQALPQGLLLCRFVMTDGQHTYSAVRRLLRH